MFSKLILGSEKAILGGMTGGSGTLATLLGTTGQITLKNALYSLVIAVITYTVTWLTTNTPKAPANIQTPVVVSPNSALVNPVPTPEEPTTQSS